MRRLFFQNTFSAWMAIVFFGSFAWFRYTLNIFELPQIEFQVKPVLMKSNAAPTSKSAERLWEMVQ